MPRVAIVGSCITRDLWPFLGEAPRDLLYISRTSLPSLFARPIRGVKTQDEPPAGLGPYQHAALVADLKKLALQALVAHRPTHIVFDFIDERFDLLSTGEGLATHSWELEKSGYLTTGDLPEARAVPRLSAACERLWIDGLAELASFLASTTLRGATLILHSAQWADRYRTGKGQVRPLDEEALIWEGRPAGRSEHNALLDRYQSLFVEAVPRVRTVAVPAHRIADESHRWGLSPFHYVPEYYREIWAQLHALGV